MEGVTDKSLEWHHIFITGFAILVDVATIFGNGLVILAWIFHPPIRSPPNAYLLSLAFADFLVGCVLFPLFIANQLNMTWPFGLFVCKLYLATLIVLCSVSIFHLILVAIDRYRATLDGVQYVQKRNYRSVSEMILLAYCCSLWLAIPLLIDDKHGDYLTKAKGTCTACKEPSWTIHLTVGMFILPGFILIRTYTKIYTEIQRRLQEKTKVLWIKRSLKANSTVPVTEIVESETDETEIKSESEGTTHNKCKSKKVDPKKRFGWICCTAREREEVTTRTPKRTVINSGNTSGVEEGSRNCTVNEMVQKKIKFSLTKEKQAAKTLGVIIGAFAVSWFPLFAVYSVVGFIPNDHQPPAELFPILVGLGYANSAMNPIIYTFYNKEFRDGFKKVLCFWKR